MKMTTRKIRAAAAVFAAALTLSVASGPLTSDADAAVKSGPTGNAELDSICQQMANLINQAYTEGDLALINGDDEGAEAWYELARDMLRRSRDAGCKMYSAKLAGVADRKSVV